MFDLNELKRSLARLGLWPPAKNISTGTDLPAHTHAAGQGGNIPAASVAGTAVTLSGAQTITGRKTFSEGDNCPMFVGCIEPGDKHPALIVRGACADPFDLEVVAGMAGSSAVDPPGPCKLMPGVMAAAHNLAPGAEAGAVITGTGTDGVLSHVAASTFAAASHTHTEDAIQLSATDKIVGRASSGGGAAEEIACTGAGRALLDDADAAAQRTTLGLGTIATQAANNVGITGGSVTGITDLAVADGGTGASTLAAANIPCVVGTRLDLSVSAATGATLILATAPVGFYRMSWAWRVTTAGATADVMNISTRYREAGATKVGSVYTPQTAVNCGFDALTVNYNDILVDSTTLFGDDSIVFYHDDAAYGIYYNITFPIKEGGPVVSVRGRLEYLGA